VIPLFSESKNQIYLGNIYPIRNSSNLEFEKNIIQSLKNDPKTFVIPKSFGNTESGLNDANTEKIELYAEIFYIEPKKNYPPELYAAIFLTETKQLIDIIQEKSIENLPDSIQIDRNEFNESYSTISDRFIRRLSGSIKTNPQRTTLRENIFESFKDKDIKTKYFPFISSSGNKNTSEIFNNLKTQFDTATRSNQKLEDIPSTVFVISKKEIRDYNYRTLVEALKYKSGIMVSEPGNGETGHSFYQRGLQGNFYTKILLNGMPISPSVAQGMPINEMLYLKNAESIEVLYGPASAVYGADAFAGVVNIKTGPKKENQAHMETTVGNMGYLNINFYATQKAKIGNDEIFVNVYGQKSMRKDQNIKNGYSDTFNAEQYYQRNGQFGDRVNFFSELPSSNSSFGSSISYKTIQFFFDQLKRSDHSSLGQQSAFYSYNDSGAIWSDEINRIALKNSFQWGKLGINTNISYNHYRLDPKSNYNLKFEKSPLYKFMGSDDIFGEQIFVYKPNRNIETVAGITYQMSGVFPKTNDLKLPFNDNFYQPFSTRKPNPDPNFGYFGYNPLKFQNTSGFLQNSFKFDENTIHAGIRYDYNTLYGPAINPRVAYIRKLDQFNSFRISYNEGFRGAPVYLTYNSIAVGSLQDGIKYLSIPNEDLKPEKLRTYEIGYRHIFNESISLETVFHHNYITNKFNSVKVPRNEILYPNTSDSLLDTFGNSGKSVLNGFDLILQFLNIHKKSQLSITLQNTFSKGYEYLPQDYSSSLSNIELIVANQLDSKLNKIDNYRLVPNRISNIRISMKPLEKWFLALDIIQSTGWYSRNIRTKRQYDNAEYNYFYNPYFQNNYIQGYTLVDLNSYYTIFPKIRVHLKITNLTNITYSGKGAYDGPNNLDIDPQYRRNQYFGIEYNDSW
jgi:hemoglobin/transferrin/lactoferrin receptor protein